MNCRPKILNYWNNYAEIIVKQQAEACDHLADTDEYYSLKTEDEKKNI